MKNIAIVLSGCGFLDGAEITEAVSTLIHLSQLKVKYKVFAPDQEFAAKNHRDPSEEIPKRNCLEESARISRGDIQEVTTLKESDFDGLIFPGGFGVALNLCTWAEKGSQCEVLPVIKKTIIDFHRASKPIGAWCIAPALLAKVLGQQEVTLTIGNDSATAQEIEKTGATHEICDVMDYVTDRSHKVVTTPAYMCEAQPCEIFKGIGGAVNELINMA